MALYVRDPEVDRLVDEVQRLTGTVTKTDVIRNALRGQIESIQAEKTIDERIQDIVDKARGLGKPDPGFDFRKFREELWGEG